MKRGGMVRNRPWVPDRRLVYGLLGRSRLTYNDPCMSRDERFTHDPDSDCAYFSVAPSIADGEAVEQVVVEREGRGEIVLDFDSAGRLLGVEIVEALALLTAETLETAP
jgi:uncharacterized protein YuzE